MVIYMDSGSFRVRVRVSSSNDGDDRATCGGFLLICLC